jgi:6,7-dimethyl-8-ribityllumazine synthase
MEPRGEPTPCGKGARETLLRYGVAEADIVERWVPGALNSLQGAQFLLEAGDFARRRVLG